MARMRAFAAIMNHRYADLHWLTELMGDSALAFIAAHAGREITLKMKIPTRAQLSRDVRAAHCHMEISETDPKNRDAVIERLARLYACSPAAIIESAKIGKQLLSSAAGERDQQ
jgi:hypothetical protein